jgi:hypothetical protein
VPDYLVSIPTRRDRDSPSLNYIIGAPSREDLCAAYPCFARAPILELPTERPEWLSDYTLDVLETKLRHVLGDEEPRWLRELVAHHANGDSYRWYALSESLDDGSTRALATLGTWRIPTAGETFSVPRSNRALRPDELRPGVERHFDVLRVTVQRVNPAASDDLDGELLVRVLDA